MMCNFLRDYIGIETKVRTSVTARSHLRYKDPDVERPFKVTGYPFTPLIFAGVCAFLIYSGINYKPIEVGISIAILFAGLVVYWITKIYEARKPRSDANQSS